MNKSRLLRWFQKLSLAMMPLVVGASCRTSECDGAVFTQYSNVTLQFDRPIVINRQLDVTIVGDDETSRTTLYTHGVPTGSGRFIWVVIDHGIDSGAGLTLTAAGIQSTPQTLTYHLVADGTIVADGTVTPTYQHCVETYDNCSNHYDQASVTITIQQ